MLHHNAELSPSLYCVLSPWRHSSFVFALTLEGLEVWTFPSDKLPTAYQGDGQPWLEGRSSGGAGIMLSPRPDPLPRPCLLHVQKLEVSLWACSLFFRSSATGCFCRGGIVLSIVLIDQARRWYDFYRVLVVFFQWCWATLIPLGLRVAVEPMSVFFSSLVVYVFAFEGPFLPQHRGAILWFCMLYTCRDVV